MLKSDIQVGETYLFIGSDSPKRAHLAGELFTVDSIDRVYRKMSYLRGKRTSKVLRFFNDEGIGARAEELEPLPGQDSEDWRDMSEEPTTEGLYVVLTQKGVYTRTKWVREPFTPAAFGYWEYDQEQKIDADPENTGPADRIEKWLVEKMKVCQKCKLFMPVSSFPSVGAAECFMCANADLPF